MQPAVFVPAPVSQHGVDDPGNETAVHQVRHEVAPLRQGAAHQGRGCGRERELEEELGQQIGRHWEADEVGASAKILQITDDVMSLITFSEAPDSCNILPPGQTKSESPVDNGSQTHVEPVFN